MTTYRRSSIALLISVAASAAAFAVASPSTADEAHAGRTAPRHHSASQGHWSLIKNVLPIGKDHAIGLKLKHHKVMWLGGTADDPADNNRAVVYDVRTRTAKEIAPVPTAKLMDWFATAGVLTDGTVVVVGGDIEDPTGTSPLSYRYDPTTNRWTRTGDLPEPQGWAATPTVRLRDGRLLAAGGSKDDVVTSGVPSRKAFVYDVHRWSTVRALDPRTGLATGRSERVKGRWDYTRSKRTHRVTTLGRGHVFGHAVLLKDGRAFVSGGHTYWNAYAPDGNDVSSLARDTDYFDPRTGEWRTGAPLPTVPGEDDRIAGSHGGRTNGVCVSVMGDGKVVIAGGVSHTDGQRYADPSGFIVRRSILVMTPAHDPARSRYRLSSSVLPPGTEFGGILGDGLGRQQLPCYRIARHRVLFAGGQDSTGTDLYDTYAFDVRSDRLTPGPLMPHDKAIWAAQHPEYGYPAGYESAVIGSRWVNMRNSQLVFADGTLVFGGAYNGVNADGSASRDIEQFTPGR